MCAIRSVFVLGWSSNKVTRSEWKLANGILCCAAAPTLHDSSAIQKPRLHSHASEVARLHVADIRDRPATGAISHSSYIIVVDP